MKLSSIARASLMVLAALTLTVAGASAGVPVNGQNSNGLPANGINSNGVPANGPGSNGIPVGGNNSNTNSISVKNRGCPASEIAVTNAATGTRNIEHPMGGERSCATPGNDAPNCSQAGQRSRDKPNRAKCSKM